MRWDARWTLVLFATAAILYWLIQLSARPPSSLLESPRNIAVTNIPLNATHLPPPLNGTYETVEGVEMVYEMPPRPKAVLLLFHGCQHSCTDWWPASEACTACKGLPEEMRITEAALAEGHAVVALSSQDRTGNRCWDTGWPPENSADIPKVTWAVQALVKQQGWSTLPMFALGGSSGGALVMLLALRMQFQAVCCQIMAVPAALLQTKPEDESGNTWKYPATAVVYMARDQRTAAGVAEMTNALAEQGVAVLKMEVQPQPLTPFFFSSRSRDISDSVSTAIYSTFQRAGLLDESGFLQDDPRQTSKQWQQLLKQHVPAAKKMNLNVDESTVHEELNLAWAGHELISDNISSVFQFFQSQMP